LAAISSQTLNPFKYKYEFHYPIIPPLLHIYKLLRTSIPEVEEQYDEDVSITETSGSDSLAPMRIHGGEYG
jgi:hypothetical protein